MKKSPWSIRSFYLESPRHPPIKDINYKSGVRTSLTLSGVNVFFIAPTAPSDFASPIMSSPVSVDIINTGISLIASRLAFSRRKLIPSILDILMSLSTISTLSLSKTSRASRPSAASKYYQNLFLLAQRSSYDFSHGAEIINQQYILTHSLPPVRQNYELNRGSFILNNQD